MCGTKHFVSVRLYSAPQSHWTIVTIHGICAFGEPAQAESFAAIKSDLLPGLGCSTSLKRQTAGSLWDAYWLLTSLCGGQRRVCEPVQKSSTSGDPAMSAYWRIVLKKSFWGDERNFLEPLMRFTRGDVRDHIDSSKIDHGPS